MNKKNRENNKKEKFKKLIKTKLSKVTIQDKQIKVTNKISKRILRTKKVNKNIHF